MTERVRADSLITLHYRIATAEDTELISTFDGNPATLKLGGGELAPTLEHCLIDLPIGERHVFLLSPEQAFGAHNPNLVERRSRAEIPSGIELAASALIEFQAPDGSVYTGFVRELTRDEVLIDFNHPLAGRRVRFEVEVIGIL